jgi:hypothetical protein
MTGAARRTIGIIMAHATQPGMIDLRGKKYLPLQQRLRSLSEIELQHTRNGYDVLEFSNDINLGQRSRNGD